MIAADLVNFHFLNGWFKVASFLAVTVPVGDGDHGRRPLPAAAPVPDLAPARPRAALGGDRAHQPARRDRPARRRLLRRHRHGELAARLARVDAAELVGAGAARDLGDRRRALHRARRARSLDARTRSRCSRSASRRSRRTCPATRCRRREPRGGGAPGVVPAPAGASDRGARSPQRARRRRRGSLRPHRRRGVRRPDRRRRRGARRRARPSTAARFAVVPGAVNAHCHSNENWFRGMWDNLPLEPWMLFSYPVLAGAAAVAGRDLRPHAARRDRDAALGRDLRRRLPLRAAGLHRRVARRGRARLPRPRPAGADRARDRRPRLPRDGRPRRGARRSGADRAARAREAAVVARVGGVRAPRGRALPPARRGHLDLPGALGAAALHRRAARRHRGARRRARPRDPHPRPRDAHAGALGPAHVRPHAARAPRRRSASSRRASRSSTASG